VSINPWTSLPEDEDEMLRSNIRVVVAETLDLMSRHRPASLEFARGLGGYAVGLRATTKQLACWNEIVDVLSERTKRDLTHLYL
jgi:hypothetical protein